MGNITQGTALLPNELGDPMQKTLHIIRAASDSWWWLRGPLVASFVFYGFGGYLVDLADKTTDKDWDDVALYYALAALVTWPFLAWWVINCRRRFCSNEAMSTWQDELGQGSRACFMGISVVFVLTLAAQLLLLLVYCADRSIAWVLSFSFISSAVAGFGAYFSIGYPGMVRLEDLDKQLSGKGDRAKPARDLPRGLISSLEAELAMLRVLAGGIVALYVGGILTVLLSLDKIPSLLGWEDKAFAQLPLADRVWFICGITLLLIALHVLVTGPVHGRHSSIILWLRHATTEKDPQ
jgi:hypothetical protein